MSNQVWDEPCGAGPRGTLIVLPGQRKTPASYRRFGARLAADGHKVRPVPVDLANLASARARVEKLIADEMLPAPEVLVGGDSGAAGCRKSLSRDVGRQPHLRAPPAQLVLRPVLRPIDGTVLSRGPAAYADRHVVAKPIVTTPLKGRS